MATRVFVLLNGLDAVGKQVNRANWILALSQAGPLLRRNAQGEALLATPSKRFTPRFPPLMARNTLATQYSPLRSRNLRRKLRTAHLGLNEATIEHLNHRPPYYWGEGLERSGLEGLTICCGACNSSRSNKPLAVWFASPYCEERGINARTSAGVVKRFLQRHPGG